jgi:hypothetical protein
MDDFDAFLVRQESDLRKEVTQRVFHDARAHMAAPSTRPAPSHATTRLLATWRFPMGSFGHTTL